MNAAEKIIYQYMNRLSDCVNIMSIATNRDILIPTTDRGYLSTYYSRLLDRFDESSSMLVEAIEQYLSAYRDIK